MNAIGTQLRDTINSGLTRWRMAVINYKMDAAAELGRDPVSKHQRRGTGRLNPSRETNFSGTHGDRGIFIFPVQLITNRIGNLTRLIHTLLYVMDHTSILLTQCYYHRGTRLNTMKMICLGSL